MQRAIASFASFGRVDDAGERQQRQPLYLFEEVAASVESCGLDVAGGHRQHPQPLGGKPVVLRKNAIAVTLDRDDRAVDVPALRRPGEQDVGRALDVAANDLPAVGLQLVEGRHELVLGVERDLGQARVEAPRLPDVQASLLSEDDECRLGRVAHDLALSNRRVVRERHRHEERLEGRVRVAPDAKNLALGRVTLPVDRVAAAGDHELAHRHLVEGQRARLVRADGRRRAEGLHRPQPFHDRTLGCKGLRSQREDGRHHSREPGRDGGDRQADPDEEELVEVVAANEPDDDDERQRDTCQRREQERQLVELARERGLLLLDLAQHPRDVAHLGRHARVRDHHLAPAPGDGRVHVGHVEAVTQRDVAAGHRLDLLQHRRALAGQGGLLDLERRGHEQASVRRDLVPGLEVDDVPRHDLLRGDVDQLAAAAGMGLDDQHLLERGDALGGLALLIEAEDRVEHGEADDDESGADLLERDDADDRGAQQDELHQVAVLAQERLPSRLRLRLRELVRPDLRAPALHLGGVEPAGRIDAELRARLLRRHAVPSGRLASDVQSRRHPSAVCAGRRRRGRLPSHRAGLSGSAAATADDYTGRRT